MGIMRAPLHEVTDQDGVPTHHPHRPRRGAHPPPQAPWPCRTTCLLPDDATLVTKLKAAGAVIMGKVSMNEFTASYGRLGFSSPGGTVLNPYSPDRSEPKEKTAKLAATAAAEPLDEPDAAGSVREPASSMSLVGINPTKGLVSLDGVIPFSDFSRRCGSIGTDRRRCHHSPGRHDRGGTKILAISGCLCRVRCQYYRVARKITVPMWALRRPLHRLSCLS
jgi:hypothetical protein